MLQISDFKHRWGISTLCLRDMSLDQAIRSVYSQGLHVFELVPRVYGGPDRFNQSVRTDLQEKLECFDTVTVHSSGPSVSKGRKADIASSDPGHRQRSIDYYLFLIHLAMDIGARLVTFHPGIGDETMTLVEVREANRAFAGFGQFELWMHGARPHGRLRGRLGLVRRVMPAARRRTSAGQAAHPEHECERDDDPKRRIHRPPVWSW